MKKLVLIEHVVPETIQRGGYTVKPGNFYGYLYEDARKYPAFWSGWISEYCIALHVMRDGVDDFSWIDEDNIDDWSILTARNFWGPFFAEVDEVSQTNFGYYPNVGDYVPFFQKYSKIC